jgi:hypothetical protein
MSVLQDKAQDILDDIIAEELQWDEDVDAYIHESVDGHENVIYYHRAHNLCRELDSDEERWALEWLEDVGTKPESYDTWATHIAYAALYTATSDLLAEWRTDNDDS